MEIRINRFLGVIRNKRLLIILCIILVFIVLSFKINPRGLAYLALLGLQGMVPIALAAIGEVFNERGGLCNIGIEGTMLLSSFVSIYLAEVSKSWLVGVLGGMGTGMLISGIFGITATYGKGDQLIAGIGVNILALGFVAYYLMEIWHTPGYHLLTSSNLKIPAISTPLTPLSWIVFVTIGVSFAVNFVLNDTRFGMRVKATGYNPFIADVSGINVYKIRTIACIIGGALAGLGGAYMSLGWLGLSAKDLIKGRGFIALACVVFSGLDPILALEAAYLFGLFDVISLWLQSAPWAEVLMARGGRFLCLVLPYVAVLITLTVLRGERRFSKMIGEPYERR